MISIISQNKNRNFTDEEDGSESSKESGEESSEAEPSPHLAKKQRVLQSMPSGRVCAIHQKSFSYYSSIHSAGKSKYRVEDDDPKIWKILGKSSPHQGLVKAAYAEASWSKINSALNALKKFCVQKGVNYELPIASETMNDFVSWAILDLKISPDSIKSYVSNLKLIHKLKGLPTTGCSNFIC
jgi:hypothetical protein